MPGLKDVRSASVFGFNDPFQFALPSHLEMISIQHNNRAFPQGISLGIRNLNRTGAAGYRFRRRREAATTDEQRRDCERNRDDAFRNPLRPVFHRVSFSTVDFHVGVVWH